MVDVKQVGGDHYGDSGYQHWDMIEEHDVSYLEARATAYVVRYDRKGKPQEDLDKAVSCLVKMGGRPTRRLVTVISVNTFCHLNNQSHEQHRVLHLVLALGTPGDIDHAIALIKLMRDHDRTKS
jgi:hypothetical protein